MQVHLGLELALHREHVYGAQGTVTEAPRDIRRDATRWLGVSARSSRRQRVKLMATGVPARRAVLLIPRVVHANDLTLLAGTLVLATVFRLVLFEESVVVVVNVPPRIVRVHLLRLVPVGSMVLASLAVGLCILRS